MKYIDGVRGLCALPSPPSRGAWIEIPITGTHCVTSWASPPSRGAWIEIAQFTTSAREVESPPSRGAWIEISLIKALNPCDFTVAPLAGGVD